MKDDHSCQPVDSKNDNHQPNKIIVGVLLTEGREDHDQPL
jgi:hypothetical protein